MSVVAADPRETPAACDQRPEVLLQGLFARISEVSSLPAVALRIIEVANDPRTGAEDLLEAVELDAALAVRIMRVVNSSYYCLPNKVGDLKLAITLLGFQEIRNLAMTAYVARLFKKGAGYRQYTREGLWNHLIGVGAVGRLVAETCGKVAPHEAYLGGLLHDLGWILLDQYLHPPFCRLLDALCPNGSTSEMQRPPCQVEEEILGFTHAELGQYVAARWHLPEHLTTAIRYHHAAEQYDGPHRQVLYVVTLANLFCHAKGRSALGVSNTRMPPSQLFPGLGLQKPHVARIWQQLDDVLKAADLISVLHAS